MIKYNEVFENNVKWIEEKKATDSEFFEKLAEGQDPEILYIGCSDSRVTCEHMMGAEPGEIFVHRNVANMVVNTDLNVMSVVEYAIKHLGVRHVVVCGHYGCGGVKAAMTPSDLGILNPWLRNIRDVYRLHQDELDGESDEEKKYNRLVELNVEEQCRNIMKTAVYQEVLAEKSRPQIHGWVFDISKGKLIDLNLDPNKLMSGIKEIYKLS